MPAFEANGFWWVGKTDRRCNYSSVGTMPRSVRASAPNAAEYCKKLKDDLFNKNVSKSAQNVFHPHKSFGQG